MNIDKLLERANNNLYIQFRNKHKQITLSDIETVYDRQLLGINTDYKTSKGTKYGYLTGMLYLAPSNISGINTCPAASAGCAAACLFTAGRGIMYTVFRARVIKTLAFYIDKQRFISSIKRSIRQLEKKAYNKKLIPVVRLNGTSDLPWERISDIIQTFPHIQFYDYTKIVSRFRYSQPANYDLTFSLSENNKHNALEVLKIGGRVAVVFRDSNLPESHWNHRVIDGDDTDLRFLDDNNIIVGLKAKGKAKLDKSGFVQDVN